MIVKSLKPWRTYVVEGCETAVTDLLAAGITKSSGVGLYLITGVYTYGYIYVDMLSMDARWKQKIWTAPTPRWEELINFVSYTTTPLSVILAATRLPYEEYTNHDFRSLGAKRA